MNAKRETRSEVRARRGAKSYQASALMPDTRLLRIALTFFAIYTVLQIAVWWLAYNGYLDPLIKATTDLTAACTVALGVPVSVAGNEISLATRILRVDLDCTGISLMLVYSALVLTYPVPVRRKLVGLVVGLPALFMANMLRLLAVARLSNPLSDDIFLFVHDYLFKVVMIGVVVGLWAWYLASARRDAAR